MCELKLTLDHEGEYKPGEVISGMVEWKYVKTKKEKPMRVNLLLYTEGRGTKDVVVEDRLELPSDIGSAAFSFPVPVHPPTFSGSLISVHWAVEAFYPATSQRELAEIIISKIGGIMELPEIPQKEDEKTKGWKRLLNNFAQK